MELETIGELRLPLFVSLLYAFLFIITCRTYYTLKKFLEIGVADFDTLLPLAEKGGWMGWCIEPMPHHVEKLRTKAIDLPVVISECAISDHNGSTRMVIGGNEDWATGASHVIDDNHEGFKVLDMPVNKHLRVGEIDVKCFTLDTYLERHHITDIDFCKIDVEGHELNILGNYSWKVKPKIIKCEHKHLPGGALSKILTPIGYTIFVEQEDIYAVL